MLNKRKHLSIGFSLEYGVHLLARPVHIRTKRNQDNGQIEALTPHFVSFPNIFPIQINVSTDLLHCQQSSRAYGH